MNNPATTVYRLASSLLFCSVLACSDGHGPEEPQQKSPPVFTEVAGQVGLDFEHFIGATGQYYLPEIMGAGVALFDFDNDGDLDIYALQGKILEAGKTESDALFSPPGRHWPGNRLFRNELEQTGRLEFTDVTEVAGVGHTGYAMGVAVGDIDNDGDLDLYITNYGSNVLYRNNGNSTFTDITESSGTDDTRWSTSASFLDFDRDQDQDLIVTSYVSFAGTNNKLCYARGLARDYCAPAAYLPVTDRLFRNDGDHFTNVTAATGLDMAFGPGLGVTAADFDSNGWPDIYVANDLQANQLWMNDGDSEFRDGALVSGTAYNGHGAAEAGMGVTAGDFDNDGDDDLFVTHLKGQTNTLYININGDSFVDATDRWNLGASSLPFTGFGTAWFDYDNDSTLDLFIANGAVLIESVQAGASRYPYSQTNQLYRFNGQDSFVDISSGAGRAMQLDEVSRGAAFGDIDNDGDIDIVVTNNNGPLRLMRNEVGNRGNWLRLRLTGTRSPRDGTGSRVVLLNEGRAILWRRAHTDGSYLSASDSRVHIGLGDLDGELEIGVEWMSGRREIWPVSAINTEMQLTEGTGKDWTKQ